MRKFLIPLLMAGAVMPSAASAQDVGGLADAFRNRGAEAQREQSNDRPQRTERPARVERTDRPERVERVDRRVVANPTDGYTRQQVQVEMQRAERTREAQIETVQRVRDDRRVRDGRRSGYQTGIPGARNERGEIIVHNPADDPRVADVRRRVERREDRDGRRWTGDWRRDHRYDWRSYRDRNRSIFRIGRYYDPYGWNYRRFSIGFSLYPNYYSSNYWLNDPWQYRLPPAYGPYRWVRYYDDALLVNIYTGQVVDAIHGFFWSTYGTNYGW